MPEDTAVEARAREAALIEALEAAEQRFRHLAALSSDWYWEQDEALRYTRVTGGFFERSGIDPAGFVGKRRDEVEAFGAAPGAARQIDALAAAREPFRNVLVELYGADGRRYIVSLDGAPAFGPAGRFRGYRGTGRDVTEWLIAQWALRESEERYRGLVEISPDAIFIWQDERLVFANRAAAALLRAPQPAALEGRSLWQIVAPPCHERVRERLRWLAGDGGTLERMEQVLERLDGTLAEVEVSATSFAYLGRLAVLALARDITERKRAERSVRELNTDLERRVAERTRELEATVAELESFSYSISHDLRAPLRAIDGFSRILVEDHATSLDPEARRLLARVSENALSMGRLIDGLLDFSRLSRKPLACHRVDMGALARSAADEALAPAGGGARCDIGELPEARGDALLLRQVWANLVGNAVKFSARSLAPRIEIGAQAAGHERVYFVRDNGAGFDMAYRDKLFGVFQRLHDGREFGGTGVGLAIVRRIVERHGGRVWAESVPGEGAAFYFSLPAAEAAA